MVEKQEHEEDKAFAVQQLSDNSDDDDDDHEDGNLLVM